jgi:hypothetical protein
MKKILLTITCVGIVSVLFAANIDSKSNRKTAKKRKSSFSQEQTEKKVESYIFPVDSKTKKSESKALQIFSGSYIGDSSAETKPEKTGKRFDFTEEEIAKIKEEKAEKEKSVIAWIGEGDVFFHDPFLPCKQVEKKINLFDVAKLSGLNPCENCFVKTNHAPDFILSESGGLDLASATSLLSEKDFISWMKSHLPIKEASFITTSKIMVYAKNEMTSKGLKQLAGEVAKAHRRHRWKVVEVMAKNSEEALEFENSF